MKSMVSRKNNINTMISLEAVPFTGFNAVHFDTFNAPADIDTLLMRIIHGRLRV